MRCASASLLGVLKHEVVAEWNSSAEEIFVVRWQNLRTTSAKIWIDTSSCSASARRARSSQGARPLSMVSAREQEIQGLAHTCQPGAKPISTSSSPCATLFNWSRIHTGCFIGCRMTEAKGIVMSPKGSSPFCMSSFLTSRTKLSSSL